MDAFRLDLRLAIRFLLRNLTFSIGAVAILALGIGLSATLFAIVRGALIRPWPYRGYDRIVTVRGNYPTQGRTAFSLWSAAEVDDFRRETRLFEQVIAGDARNVNLTYAGRPERVRAAVITPNAFAMLGVPALMGRTLIEPDGFSGATAVVVVSFNFWQTRLGSDRQVVGRTLRIGNISYAIVGVMPRQFVFWDRDLWMPLALDRGEARSDRRYYVQAQLPPGLDLANARYRLRTFAERLAGDHPETTEYRGLRIAIDSLVEDVLRDLRPTLYVLLAAVGLLLVVATANLANATLARGFRREGELALRRAIGASALQLARQLVVESAVVGAAGGLAGAAAAAFLLPEVTALVPYGYIPAEAAVDLDWRIVIAATLVATGCGIVIGLAPALRASTIDPASLLREGDTRTGSGRRHRWTDSFVFAQIAVAVIVFGAAVAAALALHHSLDRDPGYRTAEIWTARLALAGTEPAAERTRVYEQILERIRASGVDDVAAASVFPVGALPTTLVASGRGEAQSGELREAAIAAVSPGFFRLLGIPVLEGRAFVEGDRPPQPPAMVVTRNLAQRLWPDGQWTGRRIVVDPRRDALEGVVVGVIGDVIPNGALARAEPLVFVPLAHRPPAAALIGVRAGAGRDAFAVVDAAVHAIDPDVPVYGAETLDQSRVNVLGPQRLAVTLLAAFGISVLALCSVGIYAVVAQSVQERALELRIRLTFGAEPRQLLLAELFRAGKLVAFASIAGTAAAAALLRLVAHWFPGFAGPIVVPLTGSAAAIVSVALIAIAIPSWRATRFAH